MKILLLSNSTMPGTPFFTWPRNFVKDFLGDVDKELVFIPFAAVTFSFNDYEQKVSEVFSEMKYSIKSIHQFQNKQEAIKRAGAIVVGGGNSFALLSRLYEVDLLDAIREKVNAGTPYIGWSAGANLGCPTIMTTNDMPIVQPPSLRALGLVPFQINPHYHELRFEGQGGETRKERLDEFLVMNQDKRVLALPEGMLVERKGDNLLLKGDGIAKVYQYGDDVQELQKEQDVSFLLK